MRNILKIIFIKHGHQAGIQKQHKAIALLVEDQNSHTIWESLGFKKAQILKVSELSGMRDRLNALASGAGADVIANDVLIGGLKFIRGGMNETRE